jgi:ribonuclease HI
MEHVFPTKFNCPSTTSTPSELFPARISYDARPPVIRYTRRNNPSQMLIYTDGACLNNGQANPKAGWAFVFRPASDGHRGFVSSRLEDKGPYGDEGSQTSNRAELRAVLGAIHFRVWTGEGFTTLVFATDSEYVVQGATTWVRTWVRNGWRTRTGAEVKNKDLWEKLLEGIQQWDAEGFKIQFWRIPRLLNAAADSAAKQAAEEGEDLDDYRDHRGVLV